MRLGFKHSYFALPSGFYARVNPTVVADPQLVIFNDRLAEDIGLQPTLTEHEAAAVFSGNQLPEDATPLRWPTPATSSAASCRGSVMGAPSCLESGAGATACGATSSSRARDGRRSRAMAMARGRPGPDAARVPHQRSDACARHSHHALSRGGHDRRAGVPRGSSAGRRADARGRQSHSCRHLRVLRGSRRSRMPYASCWTTSSRDTIPRRVSADVPALAVLEAGRAAPGRAHCGLDARRLHPWRHEHRQHGDLGRDHRLRPVRIHGSTTTRTRCSAPSTMAGGMRTGTSPRLLNGIWRGLPRRCCRSSTRTREGGRARDRGRQPFIARFDARFLSGCAARSASHRPGKAMPISSGVCSQQCTILRRISP